MKKVLVIADSPTQITGFSRVVKNVFSNIDKTRYNIVQLGVNYFGDPHKFDWDIYPASTKGHFLGYNRINELCTKESPDLIFIFNDIWVIAEYLRAIKDAYKEVPLPKIVVYFPVDSFGLDSDWFADFGIVSQAIVYTKFGYNVAKQAASNMDFKIIPHGMDRELYNLELSKCEIKKAAYPDKPEFYEDSFIALNYNRNQPRKRIDITVDGFALFAKGKPDNVKLHLHMGIRDAGWDIIKLARRAGIEDRLIVSNKSRSIQSIKEDKLNIYLNATDVGINTGTGEGWGLCNFEHASLGVPQIVPDHSACRELFSDCGILVPVSSWVTNTEIMTIGGVVKPEDVASALQFAYENRDKANELGLKAKEKFASPMYEWKNIAKQFQDVFDTVLNYG